MTWHLLAGVPLLVLLSAAGGPFGPANALAQQADSGVPSGVPEEAAPTPMDLPAQSTVAVPVPATVSPSVKQVAADPFQYRVPEGSGGFVPTAGRELPPGIRVLGTLVLEGGQSLAALEIPGESEPVYVRENDDVQVRVVGRSSSPIRQPAAKPAPGKSASGKPGPTRTVVAAAAAGGDYVYLKISKIGLDSVVVFPEANPTNLHVYR